MSGAETPTAFAATACRGSATEDAAIPGSSGVNLEDRPPPPREHQDGRGLWLVKSRRPPRPPRAATHQFSQTRTHASQWDGRIRDRRRRRDRCSGPSRRRSRARVPSLPLTNSLENSELATLGEATVHGSRRRSLHELPVLTTPNRVAGSRRAARPSLAPKPALRGPAVGGFRPTAHRARSSLSAQAGRSCKARPRNSSERPGRRPRADPPRSA